MEVVSQRAPWLAHEKLDVIVQSGALKNRAVVLDLKDHQRALVWVDGRFSHILPPGKYAFWKNVAKILLVPVDLRETMLDIGGQEIMTADKVTLRLNAVATYRVADAHKALERSRRRPPGAVSRGPVGLAGGDRRQGTGPVPG